MTAAKEERLASEEYYTKRRKRMRERGETRRA